MIGIINDNFNDLAKDYYKLQEEYEQLIQENKQLKEEKPYLYTNTEWEDILEYQGKSYIELDRFKTIQEENKQLKEEIKIYINSNDFVYDELYKKEKKLIKY